MHLLGSILKERAHIVAQLRATDNRVVAEHHAASLQQSGIGYQLHLSHQVATGLITRQIIRDFEGDDKCHLERYAQTDSPEYKRMVDEIARRLGLTTVKFAKLEDLIQSIGMPKCKVCTHCFDGTSYCHKPDAE